MKIAQITIRRQLNQLCIGLCLLVATASVLPLVVSDLWLMRDTLDQHLRAQASVLEEQLGILIQKQDAASAQRLLSSLGNDPFINGARLTDVTQRELARFSRPASDNDPATVPDLQTLNRTIHHDGLAVGTLRLDGDRSGIARRMSRDLLISFIVLLLASLIGIAAVSRIQRRMSVPIRHLAETARYISDTGDYSRRVEPAGNRETGSLAESFNELLDYIQHRDEQLEELVNRRTLELSELNEQFKHQAYHDALTLLPNRTLYNDRLALALAHAERTDSLIAVLYLDLDHFKTINDTLGHQYGDELLIEVASRLLSCVRKDDTVARLGGDEFVILLTNLKAAADASQVARDILTSLQRPVSVDGTELSITTSIGISMYPDDAASPGELQRNADAAMYHAKELGRNNAQYFSEELNDRARRRLQLISELNRALLKDEFEVWFQPQYNILYNRVIGFEALVRWQHPERGLITPDQFVPFAEKNGLITQIDRLVLRKACQATAFWNDEYPYPLTVSVNLAVDNFIGDSLLTSVTEALDESGLDPSLLELEITEGSIMKNTDEALKILDEIKSRGIGIALDDFGTGYSSLSYLKRFPFDTIKIDKAFVRDANMDPEDAAIIRAIVAMAHSLNLRVIAEGVETEQQLQFLQALICHNIQGYYFSRPLSMGAVMDYINDDLPGQDTEMKLA